MATGTTLRSALEKSKNDGLECSICQEKFKEPKILDCVHSFCKDCLHDKYGDAPEISCPQCQWKTVLPETGIDGLKTNLHAIDRVEEFARRAGWAQADNGKLQCEMCDDDKEAEHFCLNCGERICSDCREKHSNISASSSHEVATLEDVRQGKMTVKEVSQRDKFGCSQHEGQVKQFYCKKCQELVCKYCSQTLHGSSPHKCISNADASSEYRKVFNNKLPKLVRDIQRLEMSSLETCKAKQVIEIKTTAACKAIEDRAAAVIQAVETEKEQCLKIIKQYMQDQSDKLDEHRAAVDVMLQRKQHALAIVKDATCNAADGNFLSIYPIINSYLETDSFQNPLEIEHKLWHVEVIQKEALDPDYLGQVMMEGDNWELCDEINTVPDGLLQFGAAKGIAVSHLGEIAVTDTRRKEVVICSGKKKQRFSVEANDIAATPNQWVIVNHDNVRVYNRDNTLASKFVTVPENEIGKTAVWLVSVAVKENGNVIVGDRKRRVLTEHSLTYGALIRTMPVNITPDFLAVTKDRIAISSWDQGIVDVVDDNAQKVFTIQPLTVTGKPVVHCAGVCFNISGIYIVIGGRFNKQGEIHHYDSRGKFLRRVVQGLYNPYGITFTADGQQLAVADCYSVKIYQKQKCPSPH